MKSKTKRFLLKTEAKATSNNPKTAATIVTRLGFMAFIPVNDEVSVFNIARNGAITISRYEPYDANKLWQSSKKMGFHTIDGEWGHLILNENLSENGLPTVEYDQLAELKEKKTFETSKELMQQIGRGLRGDKKSVEVLDVVALGTGGYGKHVRDILGLGSDYQDVIGEASNKSFTATEMEILERKTIKMHEPTDDFLKELKASYEKAYLNGPGYEKYLSAGTTDPAKKK